MTKNRKKTGREKSPGMKPLSAGCDNDDDDKDGTAKDGKKKKKHSATKGKTTTKEKKTKRERAKGTQKKGKRHEDQGPTSIVSSEQSPTYSDTVQMALQAIAQAEKDAVARRTVELCDESDSDSDSASENALFGDPASPTASPGSMWANAEDVDPDQDNLHSLKSNRNKLEQ